MTSLRGACSSSELARLRAETAVLDDATVVRYESALSRSPAELRPRAVGRASPEGSRSRRAKTSTDSPGGSQLWFLIVSRMADERPYLAGNRIWLLIAVGVVVAIVTIVAVVLWGHRSPPAQ